MRKCFSIFIVFSAVIAGCSKQDSDKNDINLLDTENYSIVVLKNSGADSLKKSANEITKKFNFKSLFSNNSDTLFVGDFNSEINAWYFAELFLRDSIISNYQIAFNRKAIDSDVHTLLFVSDYLNRPSLFEFDFNEKKTKMVWSQWGRKIIRLFPSTDRQKYFLPTGLTMGRSGGFPFITEARLYQYSKKADEVKRINIFGEGTQYTAGWVSKDTFKTSFITIDSFKTTTIIDHEIFYDVNGNALDTNETVYDILKDGFPTPEKDTLQINSPSKMYHVQARYEADKYIVSVFKDMSEFIGIVDTTDKTIQNITWSEDENYVAISAGEYKKSLLEGKFSIYIYSLKDKQLLAILNNQLLRDVIFYGPYLLADELVKDKQIIKIYDCYKNEMFTKISLHSDSGIFSIPIKMSRIKSENLF